MTARHSGLIATTGGRRFTSQDYTLSPPVSWNEAGDAVTFDVPWKSLGTTVFNTGLFIAFRLFTITVGRAPFVSRWLKDTLVKVLIRRKARAPITHVRRLVATPDGIEIEDDVQTPWTDGRIEALEQFTAIHMGSSLYDDARTFAGGEGNAEWPMSTGLRLRAALTRAGAAWRRENP
jgi:hypothetical protein